ncbi:type I methionyl aminopeptidase [Lentzea terrae]|uniref:type I methionyl aminopeptidase n=1 Tax=Lentzea terrae TaxID=2200761 RepID=UPI000DD30D63|nr:type I methionyl aminopeptidase [Lentzea terrae]
MIELKSAAELTVMREAGHVVARALAACHAAAAPGVTLRELDEVAREVIFSAGAKSPFLDYHPKWAPSPFPGVICASVNDAVVHGIPGPLPLRDGDLLSIDCGAQLGGMTGDAAISFVVGEAAPADVALIDCTTRALQAGIDAARPGGRLGDISHAIGKVGRAGGYGLLARHGGHGIGREMHEEPFVPNEGKASKGLKLVPGMVLALEPMLHAGGRDGYLTDDDGWTLRTNDGSRAAHVEHTVAITVDGPVVLTLV